MSQRVLSSIAWSEPKLDCPPFPPSRLVCVHIVFFLYEPRYACDIELLLCVRLLLRDGHESQGNKMKERNEN